ncbi:MAG: SusC/RagA family TonB-linked outer membrane protein [Tannerellaceae bacterium]|jgi:TonB-linked SusC/RagA family outer membrane protein|nr:SusC/RagA family TonB-linked outer membrane protein [Tannerellaceae bacterium]
MNANLSILVMPGFGNARINLKKTGVLLLLFFISFASYAQQRTISGVVTDELKEPLLGVTVLVKGTSVGTATDINGAYSLNIPADAKILRFSFLGYETKEIDIGNQAVIHLELVESAKALEEVTVTALGISREKKALGYSVGEVKGESLTKVTQENVLGALSGKVAGVQIQNTGGDPGSSVSIIIRGATSLGNDNQPLFVVDGVPVNNALNNVSRLGNAQVDYGNAIGDINPNDIESVSILKGPSAAALYGSRAGNGVVLITTKAGTKRSGIGVTVNSSVVFDNPYKYLNTQTRFTSGEMQFSEDTGTWYGPELDVGNEERQWNSGGVRTPLVSYPNKWDDFFDKMGYTVDNNVGISGNYDKGGFRISYGNMTNQGVVPNTDLTRNTVNISPVYKILTNMTISANINMSKTKSDNRPAGGGSTSDPTALFALELVPPHVNINDLKDYWLTEGMQQKSFSGKQDNPYFLAYEMTNGFVRDRVFGNVKLDWDILKNLSVMGRFALDNYSESRESRIPWSYSNRRNGAYGIQESAHAEMNADFLATYKTTVNDFNINASVGGNLMYANGRSLTNRTEKLVIPDLYTLSNADGGLTTYGNGISRKTIYSLYGMATVGYRNLAYLDFTARNDWSSTLPPDNRSYFYPSVSLSLLVNELIGIPTTEHMMKVRAGWAQVGNDTDPYSLYQSYYINSDWGSLKRVDVPGNLLSPDLKPEIATSQELGFDVNLFHNRFGVSGTYYVSNNKNQILNLSDLAPSSGYTSKKINAGMVQSTGWEIELRTVPVETKKLRWGLDFNFSRNRTKIKELTEGMDFITLYETDGAFARTRVGEYIGDIWGYTYKKVDDPSSPYHGWPLLTGNKSLGYNLLQLREDESMVKIGNFNHDFLLGVSTDITYQSLTLSAMFDCRIGGDFFSATERRLVNGGHLLSSFQGVPYRDANNLPNEIKANLSHYLGRWVGGHTQGLGGFAYPEWSAWYSYTNMLPFSGAFVPGVYLDENGEYVENLGDPATTGYGVAGLVVGENMWQYADLFIHDASYIKMREVALSYSLPREWIQPIHVQRISLSLFCRNIMLWTKNKINADPERAFNINNGALQQGLEKYNLIPQTFSFGAKLSFDF